jgi:5-(carboxyamino)imidazole ribonucleotide synthase
MLNLVGDVPDPAAVLAVPGAHLHLYGKDPRPARKVGHVTLWAEDDAQLAARLEALAPWLHAAD